MMKSNGTATIAILRTLERCKGELICAHMDFYVNRTIDQADLTFDLTG